VKIHRGDKKSNALEIPCGYPKLGWQICAISLEDIHAFVSKSMSKIQDPNEEKGNSEKQKIMVTQKPPRVPGKDKNSKGYDNAR
jgi:hypothetical protein